jgi:signal transduction histidine kinase
MDALGKAQELTRKALSSVRESVAALRVSPVENRSLENAIAGLVDESRSYGIPIHFSAIGESRLVGGKSGLAFYRAAQEGLTNACKHSRASCIDVELDFSQHDTIRLMVRDNGVGAADVSGGFGLIGIRERVHLLGGEFKMETQPDQGFCIEVILPVDEGEHA